MACEGGACRDELELDMGSLGDAVPELR
jgi:hypothetical protein